MGRLTEVDLGIPLGVAKTVYPKVKSHKIAKPGVGEV